MWRHVAANALTFFIVALFFVAGLIAWGTSKWSQPGPLEASICLEVESDSTMRSVSRRLAEQGAISSEWIFRAGADYTDRTGRLKAGSFLIPASASMDDIAGLVTGTGASTCGTEIVYVVGVSSSSARVRELDPTTGEVEQTASFDFTSGEPAPPEYEAARAEAGTTYWLRVIEGATSWQVAQALDAIDILEGEVAAVPAEGTLAPNTYDIEPGAEVEAVLDRMEAAQTRNLAEAWAARAEDLPFETPEEALTLASIVEKETAVPEERAVVASVLVNRIEQGMRLQFDPTIIYGITRGEGVLDRPIRQSDIEGATERELHGEVAYNTYVIDGLPAGPIANPGRAAIEAAMNPSDTEFLYFVADGSGGHAFASTLEEHNANVARWRALEAERAAAAAEAEPDE